MKGMEVITNRNRWGVVILFIVCCSFSFDKEDLIFFGKRQQCKLILNISNGADTTKAIMFHLYGAKFFDKKNNELNLSIDSVLDGGLSLIVRRKLDDNFNHNPSCSKDSTSIFIDSLRSIREIVFKPLSNRLIEISVKGKKRIIRRIRYFTFLAEEDGIVVEKKVEIVQ